MYQLTYLFLIVFISCQENLSTNPEIEINDVSKTSNSIFVKGDGKNIFPLVTADPNDYNRMTTYFVIDSSEFKEIKLDRNKYCFFYCGNDLTPYLLQAEDSLDISVINGNGKIKTFNNDLKRDKEIDYFRNAILAGIPLIYHEIRNFQGDFLVKPNFSIKTFKLIEEKINNFNKLEFNAKSYSPEMMYYYATYTHFNLLSKALMFGDEELKEMIYLKTPLNSFKLDSLNIDNIGYRGFIYQYCKNLKKDNALYDDLITSDAYQLFEFMELINGNKKIPISNEEYASLNSNIKLQYDAYLQTRNSDRIISSPESNQVQTINGDFKDFDDILKNGRVKFIDFWASWCAPCRAEMPASKVLKNKYLENEIDFVFLSIDKNLSAWKKASDFENLSSIEFNYLVNDPKQLSFLSNIKISTIPRYMIIGGDGSIVNANAASPSSSKLIEQLNVALKKKG